MSRLSTRLLAVLAPTALLLPAAAHAEKAVTQDAVGDVLSFADPTSGSEGTVAAPHQAGSDIVRTAVAHGASRLRVTVHYRALERDPLHFTIVRILTPEGAYDVTVERLGGTPITSMERGRRTVDCGGLKAKVNLSLDTVTASLPTSCIETPGWVRVGVGAVAVSESQTAPGLAAAYADDAHRDGTINEDSLAKGPKVRRG